jgi:hypothetical protein
VAEAASNENSQRDINIAFVNELAKIFKDEYRYQSGEAAATKWNFLPLSRIGWWSLYRSRSLLFGTESARIGLSS